MEVLCFDFLLTGNLNAIEHPELRHMEQALKPIMLASLQRIDTEVHLSQQR